MNAPLITPDLVRLDVDFGGQPSEVIGHLAELMAAAGRATDAAEVAAAATAREEKAGTGAVSYTHLTLPTTLHECRSRWSPYH